LQSALRELTHKLYEVRRQKVEPTRAEARWDYASAQFRAEYLGHTLHLVDAMILELRNAQDASPEAMRALDEGEQQVITGIESSAAIGEQNTLNTEGAADPTSQEQDDGSNAVKS
jgi:hypothetical protein